MIPITEILSTSEEIHAFVVGVSHGWFFWQKHQLITESMWGERHYYGIGKIFGMVFFGVFMACLGWIVKEVIF